MYMAEAQELNEAILYLIDTSRHAVSTLELDKIMDHIIAILPRIIEIDASIVRLADKRNSRLLSLEGSYGLPHGVVKKIKYLRMGVGIEGSCVKNRSHLVIKDISKNKRTKYVKELGKCKIHSALCVPIIFDNDVYGTVTVYSKKKDKFHENDRRLLTSFTNVVGIALKNAFLYQNLKETYLSTINSLILIMESRDPYMRGHSERVTYISIQIARQLNLSESDLGILRTAGRLHDIGKITISDKILSKADRLTPTEWAEIHLHPIRGVEIVMPLKFLDMGLSLIRNHHERYDGRGYPDGLRGDTIPVLARILSVADAFDAMTSARPYRDSFSFEKAVSEIKTNSGTQFDPAVTKAFVKIIDRIK